VRTENVINCDGVILHTCNNSKMADKIFIEFGMDRQLEATPNKDFPTIYGK
jgi:hypothetical protein